MIPLLLKFTLLLEQALKLHFVAVVYFSLERKRILGDELCEFLLWNNVKRIFSRLLTNCISNKPTGVSKITEVPWGDNLKTSANGAAFCYDRM